MGAEIQPMQGQIQTNTGKTEKTGILKFYEFFF